MKSATAAKGVLEKVPIPDDQISKLLNIVKGDEVLDVTLIGKIKTDVEAVVLSFLTANDYKIEDFNPVAVTGIAGMLAVNSIKNSGFIFIYKDY